LQGFCKNVSQLLDNMFRFAQTSESKQQITMNGKIR